MRKSLVYILLVALVASQSLGAVVKSKEDSPLKFLGQYKKPFAISGLNAKNEHVQQTSFYFLSQNSAGHATAENDCVAQLGENATLLNIETAEELSVVTDFLASSDDTGSTYWTGGKYDPNGKKFVWGNNVEVDSLVPWDIGFPDTQTALTRVVAYTVGSLKLRTQFQTVSNRYICELQTVTKAPLQYVGQYKHPHRKTQDRKVSAKQTSFYFLSQNAAGFQTAENDCKAFLGDDATLLYIETLEELGNVTEFLSSSDDTGSTYWVGAKYDTVKQKFAWLNGAELGPWAPWEAGMPNTQTPLTRVSVYTVGDVQLRTQFNTVSNRYICELGAGIPEEEAIPCYNDNDLVIVVDSSGSIGQENYKIALEFTTRLAIAWADNPKNRVSVLIYANTVQSILSLPEALSVAEVRERIYNAPYLAGSTASHLGLDAALKELTDNPSSVPENVVFMTDGGSDNPTATAAAADRIQSAGVSSFAIGIGSSPNPTELLAIAGGKQEHVFNTGGFEDLLKLLQPVSIRVCG